LRALLLSGHPIRHRAQARPRRGRRPGRAQNFARLSADDDLFGALHRRSGAAARDRGFPQARARLCGGGGRGACGCRAIPQGMRRESMPAYDANNIFAKILRGELPCYKIYEDDKALAFLDIMPRASGHALILPKAPARNILDASPDDLAHVIKVAQKIAKASVEVFGADGVTIQQFNESAGGQVVFHLHVHVIPRKVGVALKPPASVKEAPDVLAEQAKQLAAALR